MNEGRDLLWWLLVLTVWEVVFGHGLDLGWANWYN